MTIHVKNSLIPLLLILLAAFLFRYPHLAGDAPAGDISRSGVFYVDEGTYAHNAVNKALFGQWFLPDDYNPISNVPIFSVFQYVILKMFGKSLTALRLGGIAYGLCSLLLLWILLRPANRQAAWMALALGASNYFFIIYNRLALIENLLVLFLMAITLFLFLYQRKTRLVWLLVSALFFVAGFFVKPTILFFSPLFLLAIFSTTQPRRSKIKHLLLLLVAVALLAVISFLVWVLPHQADWRYFTQLNVAAKFSFSPARILENYGRYLVNLKLFQFMPVTYTLALFHAGLILLNRVRNKPITFAEQFFAGWALCAFLFLGFFAYSPPRFSLILTPVIFGLASLFLARLIRGEYLLQRRQHQLLLLVTALVAGLQIGFGIFRLMRDGHYYLSCFLPLVSLAAILLLSFLPKIQRPGRIAFGLLGLMLGLNIFQIGHYHAGIRYSYHSAMKDIEQTIMLAPKQDRVIAGDIAPLVATELSIKAVNIRFREETERHRFLQQKPRFLILQDKNELDRLRKKMPDYLSNVRLIRSYRIFDNYINNEDTFFYKIN